MSRLLRKRYVLTYLLLGVLIASTAMAWWLPESTPEAVSPLLLTPHPYTLNAEEVRTDSLAHEEAAVVEEEPVSVGFSPEKAAFAVQVKNEVIPYRVFGVFVMPGETLEIEAVFTQGTGSAALTAASGAIQPTGPETWTWTAPAKKGLHPVTITDTATGTDITLHMIVKVPFDHRSAHLNGYRIGRYEATPLRDDPVYNRPEGFIEVTPENYDLKVSPHFTLGQFLCKQTSDFPKYLLLRERMLLKLEMILEAVNDLGFESQTLHVMSGFRTPYYNRLIGNTTFYSRHLYGGAADIYLDTDGDNYMDDLTGDNQVTTEDARVMAGIVEGQTDQTWYQPFIGGLGIYSPAPHRGPFIHVDVRGTKARW